MSNEKKWREAADVPEDVEVVLMTPQFERPKNEPAPCSYPGHDVLASLQRASVAELPEFGLCPWNDPAERQFGDRTLWLLPGEWYSRLPAGFAFTTIMGREEVFDPGVTDDDIRFGCLAYGILVP